MSFPSINPRTLLLLPRQMQVEGVLLALEGGLTLTDMAECTGLGEGALRSMVQGQRPPFRRGEDFNGTHPKGDEE